MKIVALNASPTKNGNCEKILNKVIEGAEGHDIIKYNLDSENISPCKSCRYCWKHPGCIHNDNGNKILRDLEEVDVLVICKKFWGCEFFPLEFSTIFSGYCW